MYLTVKQQLKNLSKEDYLNLKELSHIAKNLYNVGTYNVRQYYFQGKEYLKHEQNNVLCKENENYKLLNSNMSQQILKEVDGNFKSFFGLLKLAKKDKYDYRSIKLPKYLDKDGFTTSGKRIKRGLYKTKNGYILNADVNGALNILKKSSVVCLNALYSSGEVDTPVRTRIA